MKKEYFLSTIILLTSLFMVASAFATNSTLPSSTSDDADLSKRLISIKTIDEGTTIDKSALDNNHNCDKSKILEELCEEVISDSHPNTNQEKTKLIDPYGLDGMTAQKQEKTKLIDPYGLDDMTAQKQEKTKLIDLY